MAQTRFTATGITVDNTDSIKETGMAVAGVKWVNVNGDNIVVTHEDSFDDSAFINTIQSIDNTVSLSK